MDYIVRDSSRLSNINSTAAVRERDNAIYVGIVREERSGINGILYVVEVNIRGQLVLVGCSPMVRFGGAHNYEEYGIRSWLHTSSGLLSPGAGGKYETKAGDVVIVAFLNGKSREGIILGGLNHSSRKKKIKSHQIAYLSEFNGIETSIEDSGSYKVSFKGYSPTNDTL